MSETKINYFLITDQEVTCDCCLYTCIAYNNNPNYILQVDWDKALKVCASENGQLVRIESPQKDISLQGFLAGKSETKS